MIQKFEDFIKESHSKSIKLTPEEVSLFTSEPILQKLISDKKVSLYDVEVKFDENDSQTKEILDQYLEIPGKIEESLLNEDKKDVSDMYVTIGDDDEEIQHILNIETEDGKKYYTKLKTFNDFRNDEDEDEYEDG